MSDRPNDVFDVCFFTFKCFTKNSMQAEKCPFGFIRKAKNTCAPDRTNVACGFSVRETCLDRNRELYTEARFMEKVRYLRQQVFRWKSNCFTAQVVKQAVSRVLDRGYDSRRVSIFGWRCFTSLRCCMTLHSRPNPNWIMIVGPKTLTSSLRVMLEHYGPANNVQPRRRGAPLNRPDEAVP